MAEEIVYASTEETMKIAEREIKRWQPLLDRLAEYDSHGHTNGLEDDNGY